jgi:hypothetical protein
MTDRPRVVGLFRDARQAEQAAAEARRRGLQVGDETVQDADGVHVVVHAASNPDDARQLLLQFGAYRTLDS